MEDEEEETPLNLQDLLPLFVHEKPVRSSTEAAQDEYDGMQTRESREGVVESLSDARKWLLSDDLLECEEARRYKQEPTSLQAALATSTACPHLFHAPEPPRPPLHIRDLITRDKDVLDRRAYLKEQKLLDFAKSNSFCSLRYARRSRTSLSLVSKSLICSGGLGGSGAWNK